jgi:alginate O-acetyltransferase complex protein AlgI
MLFNSFHFWFFLGAVLLLYRALPHRGQNRMLLLASYVFYGAWDWRFLSLIWISTLVDYVAGRAIAGTPPGRSRRAWLLASLAVNLGLLGVFKYYGWFSRELADLLGTFGLSPPLPALELVLPVGISFYTFQTLSYTIDVYRGHTSACRNLPDFALYVAFFPQLVAGPIERSARLLPQMLRPRRPTGEDFRAGTHEVMLGLFKKVVVADNMAPIVDTVFAKDPSTLTGAECLVGLYAFAFQIYGDFSGYSSIAKGVARWMGIDIMTNFDMPYLATSPRDFWRRWHISLSTWLRDYLYVPLGGNRRSRLATYRNLILTMLLGGLWHGAAWTFVAWGLFHGAWLALHRLWDDRRPRRGPASPWARTVSVFLTFHAVCLGWLLFRAESLAQVWGMLAAMGTNPAATPFALAAFATVAFFVLPLFVYEAWMHRRRDGEPGPAEGWRVRGLVYAYCALMLLFFPPPVSHEFIYFQF